MDNQRRQDEFDVDFDDTREFAASRYKDIQDSIAETLSPADQLTVQEPRSWQDLSVEIRSKLSDPKSSSTLKRLISSIQPLPRSLATLNGSFISSVTPHDVQFNFLWGLVYLNLKLSYDSPSKLARTAEWLSRLRKVIELFNRCLEACEDLNEPRLAIVDVYDHALSMLGEALLYLRANPTDAEATKAWASTNSQLVGHLADLDATAKHLNDITSYSAVNIASQVKNMSLRHAPVPDAEEHAAFPNTIIPYQQNEDFYGRTPEMQKIISCLSPSDENDLRTYTIYGRRGVGKTEIALQYAHDNPSKFDAIFWIQCETSVSLRQSFTDVAVSLNLPGADRNGHHEENLMSVQKWLKLTRKRWLLIFDNAERESILKGYWPVGAKGSILITSRKYYNFMKDANRRGDTVRPFSPQQSYELLMQLLGEKWQLAERRGTLPKSEINAAKTLLSKIGGLALAIQQAAVLINNPEIGGSTIGGALELFNSNSRRLPERPVGEERSESIHSLDTLWNMSFSALSGPAREFLSVLAMLSPDKMLIDLFLPRKQSVLNGKLSFMKQHQRTLDERKNLATAIQIPDILQKVIDELLSKELIKKDGRVISIHREVQEAMNYHSMEDLQESFDAAVALVYEAFPKAWTGDSLHTQWSACQNYITHGVHIGQKYSEYNDSKGVTTFQPSDTFTALLANCAWYLYEIGDYETCLRLVKTAGDACEDKNSSRYANICNTAGACYFDQNRLEKCRENYEITLQIQETVYGDDALKLGIILNNMGNLETGQGRYEEALDFFQRAIQIRIALGDAGAGQLALSYMCLARLYYYQQQFEAGMKMLASAEALFVRTQGAETHFMAFVHFSNGNIEFALNHLRAAKRSYSDALKVALAETPIHPITAAIYYRMGCVESAMKHDEVARSHLEKALKIAEMRSPARDDGTIARICWKLSKVLESDILSGQQVTQLRTRAELARRMVVGRGEGDDPAKAFSDVQILDDEGNVEGIEEEEVYRVLVPIFFQ